MWTSNSMIRLYILISQLKKKIVVIIWPFILIIVNLGDLATLYRIATCFRVTFCHNSQKQM